MEEKKQKTSDNNKGTPPACMPVCECPQSSWVKKNPWNIRPGSTFSLSPSIIKSRFFGIGQLASRPTPYLRGQVGQVVLMSLFPIYFKYCLRKHAAR